MCFNISINEGIYVHVYISSHNTHTHTHSLSLSLSLYIYIYIYIYVCVCMCMCLCVCCCCCCCCRCCCCCILGILPWTLTSFIIIIIIINQRVDFTKQIIKHFTFPGHNYLNSLFLWQKIFCIPFSGITAFYDSSF